MQKFTERQRHERGLIGARRERQREDTGSSGPKTKCGPPIRSNDHSHGRCGRLVVTLEIRDELARSSTSCCFLKPLTEASYWNVAFSEPKGTKLVPRQLATTYPFVLSSQDFLFYATAQDAHSRTTVVTGKFRNQQPAREIPQLSPVIRTSVRVVPKAPAGTVNLACAKPQRRSAMRMSESVSCRSDVIPRRKSKLAPRRRPNLTG